MVAQTSRRLFNLAIYVLRQYMLPNIQLVTAIDQEGRRKITVYHRFNDFDATTFRATFVAISTTPKRYRCSTSIAAPMLRNLSMIIQPFSSELHAQLPISLPNTSFLRNPQQKFNIGYYGIHRITGHKRSGNMWHYLYSVRPDVNVSQAEAMDSSGFTTKSDLLQFPKPYGARVRSERYVTPICLTVHLSMLCQVPTNKSKWKKATHWLREKYHMMRRSCCY
ncbi:hypothetical protein DFQ28_005461 [Apophysomyces sp. BC1034]|nr:hypothetical protein DFQ28_005461 [Apophysomyces sp. BC1034]